MNEGALHHRSRLGGDVNALEVDHVPVWREGN